MTEERDIRIPILRFALDKDHRIDGDVCVCGAGRSKCGGVPSLWTREFADIVREYRDLRDLDAAFDLMSEGKNLFAQIDGLKGGGVMTRKGRLYSCILEDKVDEARRAVEENDITILVEGEISREGELEEEEIETPGGRTVRTPFRRAPTRQDRGARWSVAFGDSFWSEGEDMWAATEENEREYQLALCLRGDEIVAGGRIVGNREAVEALDRDLVCPSDTVKVGSMHTHPPSAQAELDSRRGVTKGDVEGTMVQSIPDLRLMIKFNDPIECVRSQRSVNCMINHSDYLNRELFRDIMVGAGNYIFDKGQMMGEMIRRGIRKHKQVSGGITVSHPNSILCEPEGPKLICRPAQGNEAVGGMGEEPSDHVETRMTEIHATGVEVTPTFDRGDNTTKFTVRSYASDEASCWVGYDGYIWCEGHDSMGETELSKRLLQPLYEKRIWDVLNGEGGAGEGGARLLEHYIRTLRTSPDRQDQKKARMLEGTVSDFREDGDADKFARRVLSSITIT
jgi:hypothetical protein